VTARRLLLLPLLLLGAGLLGCDTTATQPDSQVVVEAYLQAGHPLPPVRLTRTVGARASFSPAALGVEGASVEVQRLGGDGAVQTTVSYTERDTTAGLYFPTAPPTVQSQATYRLRVTTGEGTTLTSTTTVPGPIEIAAAENDTTVYQSPAQPSFTVSVPRRSEGQNVFTFTTTSLLDFANTPDSALAGELTPFYREGYDADEDSIDALRLTSSGLLNEGNFTRNANSTITVDFPWLAVAFFGPNEVGINVVDDNYYDFLRSQNVQQGGFAPGEIPNVIEHVDGGTGIFGSYAQASRPVLIRRPRQQP
jgi:hypothetical protein